MRLILFIVLLAASTFSKGSGPVVPCPNCEEHIFGSPESGLWYNTDEPGSGLSLEFQNGILLGGYYGYSTEGSAQWYTFAGALEPALGDAGPLTLRTTLQRYEGGACPNCAYVPPVLIEDVGSIEIEFTQRNYGSFTINGGERKFIVPLVAGLGVTNPYPDVSDYLVPELSGVWTLALEDLAVIKPWGRSSIVVSFEDREVLADDRDRTVGIRYALSRYISAVEKVNYGSISCVAAFGTTDERDEPSCAITILQGFPSTTISGVEFELPPAGISDGRFDATARESGLRLYGYRVNYD